MVSQVNDCKYLALSATYGDGQINGLYLKYLKANGATSDNINDAEYEFLIANGATAGQRNDMWLEVLLLLGAPNESLADNLLWFWCVNGGGSTPTLPAFDALTYDPSTYEMLGVKTGTGDLSAVSSSTHYARDHEGVYQQFAANTPVWHGGRCVLTGGAGSLVDKVYADDGAGAPLAEVPWLQFYPAATNSAFHSNDLTNVWWTPTNVTVSQDEIGLTGAANTATRLTATANTGTVIGTSVAAPTGTNSGCFYVKRDIGASSCEVTVDGGATWESITLTTVFEKFTIEKLDGDQIGFRLAFSGDSIIVGNAELHTNKTIAQVRGLDPIFTTTAEVATTKTVYTYDIDNHSDSTSCYYMEIEPSWASTEGVNFQGMLDTTTWNSLIYVSANAIRLKSVLATTSSVTRNFDVNEFIKIGGAYGVTEDLMVVSDDGGYGSEVTYGGAFATGTVLTVGASATHAFRARGIQRYDAADYAEAKTILDGKMADTNLYVNSKLIGGDSPFAHTVGFGTAEFNGTWWVQDYFTWESNFPQDNARAYLNYNVAANNPDLVVGETYRFTYRVRSDNPLAQCLSVSAVTNVTAVYGTRMPGTVWGEVTVDITIDAPGWACTVRCGTGTTAPSFQHVQVRKPTLVKL